MKDQHRPTGFTVIEVMLFLAITGLMIAGLMVGVGGTINRERYNDAVTSLYDFMQGQYNLIDNVNTNRPDSFRCDSGGITDAVSPADYQPRGTSDCTIVGRLVTTSDGQQLVARPIYATANLSELYKQDLAEADLLDAMALDIAPDTMTDDNQRYRLAWDTSLYINADTNQDQFSLVMVRLPTNSLVRTFVSNSAVASIDDVIDNPASSGMISFCVAPDGLVSTPALGVNLLPASPNANGVQRTVGSSGDC